MPDMPGQPGLARQRQTQVWPRPPKAVDAALSVMHEAYFMSTRMIQSIFTYLSRGDNFCSINYSQTEVKSHCVKLLGTDSIFKPNCACVTGFGKFKAWHSCAPCRGCRGRARRRWPPDAGCRRCRRASRDVCCSHWQDANGREGAAESNGARSQSGGQVEGRGQQQGR